MSYIFSAIPAVVSAGVSAVITAFTPPPPSFAHSLADAASVALAATDIAGSGGQASAISGEVAGLIRNKPKGTHNVSGTGTSYTHTSSFFGYINSFVITNPMLHGVELQVCLQNQRMTLTYVGPDGGDAIKVATDALSGYDTWLLKEYIELATQVVNDFQNRQV